MDSIRLYFRLIWFSFRSQLAYRASFCLQLAAYFVVTAMEFLAVWALMQRFGQLQGWTLPEICFFYGIVNITFAVAEAIGRGFDQFHNLVRAGEFDRLLLRPRTTVLQLLGHELTLRRVGRLVQGAIVLTFGFTSLPALFHLSNLLLVAWTVLCGVTLFLGILIVQATVCFWTIESIEMMNILTHGGVFTAQYPLSIYDAWIRKFFLYVVPLGCVSFIPILGVLGRSQDWGFTPLQAWLCPLAGPLFLIAALGIWRFGVRHYCSTGS